MKTKIKDAFLVEADKHSAKIILHILHNKVIEEVHIEWNKDADFWQGFTLGDDTFDINIFIDDNVVIASIYNVIEVKGVLQTLPNVFHSKKVKIVPLKEFQAYGKL